MYYKIVQKEAFDVLVKIKEFETNIDIPKYWDVYFEENLHKKVCGQIGICIENKEDCTKFKYGIGCISDYANGVVDGFETIKIPKQEWAIFKCVGPMPGAIVDMWSKIEKEGIYENQYDLSKEYNIEYYTDGCAQDIDYISEIWIPVINKKPLVESI